MLSRTPKNAILMVLAIVAVAAWALLQSGSSPTAAADAGVLPLEPELAAAAEGVLPLDAIFDDPAGNEAVFSAKQMLYHDCMADAGYEYTVTEYIPDPELPRYGLDDATIAAEYGYAWLDGAGLSPGDLNAENATAPGWDEAFFGTDEARYAIRSDTGITTRPGDGCLWEADLVLYGENPAVHYALVGAGIDIRAEALERFSDDPRVGGIVAEWSQCMAAAGWDIDSPGEAHRLRTADDPDGMEPAVADVRCKQKVDLVDRLLDIESSVQATLLIDNAESISRLQTSWRAAVERANAVLEGD